MGPIETEMKKLCASVLTEIEAHLTEYPMGESYFGRKAASNPYLISKLRAGKIVEPKSLDKVREYMQEREKSM